MDEYETARLPTAIETPRERLRVRYGVPSTNADFLSQLIAERQHLPIQRERRRVPVGEAVDAYANGSRMGIRRMPAGYRTTILA